MSQTAEKVESRKPSVEARISKAVVKNEKQQIMDNKCRELSFEGSNKILMYL